MNVKSKRLMAEIRKVQRERSKKFYVYPETDNLHSWKGFIMGPEDSPYSEAAFEIRITLHENHPMQPPKVKFLTKIFHPNIDWRTGEVCIDILKSEWSPMWNVMSLEAAISSILMDPNADSPLNCDAGNMIRGGDLVGFRSTARLCAKTYGISKKEYEAIFED